MGSKRVTCQFHEKVTAVDDPNRGQSDGKALFGLGQLQLTQVDLLRHSLQLDLEPATLAL